MNESPIIQYKIINDEIGRSECNTLLPLTINDNSDKSD